MPTQRRQAGAQMAGMSTGRRIGANIRAQWSDKFKPVKAGQKRATPKR